MLRAVLFTFLLTLGAQAGDRGPAAWIAADGALMITLPATLVESAEVSEQLTSGLTTVFIVSTEARDGRRLTKGGARIEIRLELWEEKYLVSVIGPTGEEGKLSFASQNALKQWWGESPLMVSPPSALDKSADVEVTMKMLPFSSQEQSATRRWLSRTLSASRRRINEPTPTQSAEILRIIVETSVQRRPLLQKRWRVRATHTDRR